LALRWWIGFGHPLGGYLQGQRLTVHEAIAIHEGDGVFFIGEGVASELIQWLEGAYVTFHRRMRTFVEGGPHGAAALSLTG